MSRDQRFYLPDGNTTICVCNTLFKVHQSIICQDGSAFGNMFSVCNAPDDGPREGDSDETPIYLQGDSLDEFRDLLWSLYALPHEIGTMMSPLADVAKLVNIARMTHKYHFEKVEAWALATLIQRLETENSTPVETHSLTHITEVAKLCDDAKLLQVLHTKWKCLIEEDRDLSTAINLFERLGNFPDLIGLAYHAMMLQGREKWNSTDPPLTREQRIRLLSGFYAINEICANFSSKPATYLHRFDCEDVDTCEKLWELLWKDITTWNTGYIGLPREVVAPVRNDLIGTMTRTMDVFDGILDLDPARWPWPVANDCLLLAIDATILMFQDLKARLADLFQDVE